MHVWRMRGKQKEKADKNICGGAGACEKDEREELSNECGGEGRQMGGRERGGKCLWWRGWTHEGGERRTNFWHGESVCARERGVEGGSEHKIFAVERVHVKGMRGKINEMCVVERV